MSITTPLDEQMDRELTAVRNTLVRANKTGLIVEVVYFALTAVQAQPHLSIEDALAYALREWDC